ncbi:DUF2231 domain-containing protein [Afifella sp. H1R]|uniref:DUF2231 domain-containing protein n=1 Tax=Afifella sp. H1R TaxID=2908841 RepID=UPI001F38090B|nr:DUF2231 domain-containing protein [Afifella sp. H1R]MCF1503205.1 DUF2231 domain-containing protein [Afifella sp. H1R]
MAQSHPAADDAVAGQPIHAVLVQFPTVCFTLALLTDLAYWQTANLMWQNFSAWLLFVGLVVGVLAALVGIIDILVRRSARRSGAAWPHAIGSIVVLVLAFINSLIHAGDGWTAVVPWGLTLSILTVLVMIATGFLGRSMTASSHRGDRDHA